MSFTQMGTCARESQISLCRNDQETLQQSGKYKISLSAAAVEEVFRSFTKIKILWYE